ncbi:hypothetical protein L2E82_15441 [Cichorium intybus]|uniref:Uncharacterized protein n=1 Tax=Cichorium intybus TaxID=13427 RepID=A0ACB9F3R2_CICIN|nr:hypothetical protein L2E82_15441 [Cichorium intybus]
MGCVLSTVPQLGSLEVEASVTIHGHIIKTLPDIRKDVYIGRECVDMYAKCECLDSALTLFKNISHKNMPTWTTIVSELAILEKGRQDLKFFTYMTKSEILYIWLLLHHYGCIDEHLEQAGQLFEVYEFVISETAEDDELLWRSLLHSCRINDDMIMGKIIPRNTTLPTSKSEVFSIAVGTQTHDKVLFHVKSDTSYVQEDEGR